MGPQADRSPWSRAASPRAVVDEVGPALDRLQLPWRERARAGGPARSGRRGLALSVLDYAERIVFRARKLIALLCAPALQLSEEGERLLSEQLAAIPARIAPCATIAPTAASGPLGSTGARSSRRPGGAGDDKERKWHERQVERAAEARRACAARHFIDARLPESGTPRVHARAREPPRNWGFSWAEARGCPLGSTAAGRSRARRSPRWHGIGRSWPSTRRFSSWGLAARRSGRIAPASSARVREALVAAASRRDLRRVVQGAARCRSSSCAKLPGRSFDHLDVIGFDRRPASRGPTIDSAPLRRRQSAPSIRAPGAPCFELLPEGKCAGVPPAWPRSHSPSCSACTQPSQSILLLFPRADCGWRELVVSTLPTRPRGRLGHFSERAVLSTRPHAAIPQLVRLRLEGELLARASLEAFAEPASAFVERPLEAGGGRAAWRNASARLRSCLVQCAPFPGRAWRGAHSGSAEDAPDAFVPPRARPRVRWHPAPAASSAEGRLGERFRARRARELHPRRRSARAAGWAAVGPCARTARSENGPAPPRGLVGKRRTHELPPAASRAETIAKSMLGCVQAEQEARWLLGHAVGAAPAHRPRRSSKHARPGALIDGALVVVGEERIDGGSAGSWPSINRSR